MKAVVYHKPKDVRVEQVPDPTIQSPTDGIVRITSTAICGSDLHIYNGFLPQPRPMVLGHEFMGVVEATGADVHRVKVGDRVVVGFSVTCGTCWFCMHAHPSHCERSNPKSYGPDGGVLEGKGGGLFGYTDLYGGHDGGQAEAARVPWIDATVRRVPDDIPDEHVLFASDILPTGWAGIEWSGLQPGETVAILGAGPVGLATAKIAWLRGAGRVIVVDLLAYRLEKARLVARAETINASVTDTVETLRAMTEGRGPDVCVDAVGMEVHRSAFEKVANVVHGQAGSITALDTCMRAVRRCGRVSVLGVYGSKYDNFPFHRHFDKGLSVKGGQSDPQSSMDAILTLLVEERLRAHDIASHTLPLEDAARAYRIFNDKLDDCVKVVLKP
ncbi:MAG: alcohol dehydrogenase catalytic domain-containing protein [Pseudomonadota bacterium]|nr:alcohol dehydrogenase catalytic domain-containing protein [Pseudomonadota bacterium]